MESEALRARCPECQKEYEFYADPVAADPARILQEPRPASDGRLVRRCFACSFRKNPWDALWIPGLVLGVATLPLTWMVGWAILGHFLVLSVVAYPLWRFWKRFRQGARRDRRDARTGDAADPLR